MKIECPKCKGNKIFKRKSVPRIEIYVKKFIEGKEQDVLIEEPKFFVCYECWNKFNIKD